MHLMKYFGDFLLYLSKKVVFIQVVHVHKIKKLKILSKCMKVIFFYIVPCLPKIKLVLNCIKKSLSNTTQENFNYEWPRN